jgi:ABC-type multidrug transport system ATPase subunit
MKTNTTRSAGPIVIDIENITKEYVMGEELVRALRGVSLRIHRNEYLAIMGPSGSGKSTLMNMLGCLDTPTSGRYEFNGRNVAEKSVSCSKPLICCPAQPVCEMSSYPSFTQESIRRRAKSAQHKH